MIDEYEAIRVAEKFLIEKLGEHLEYVSSHFQRDPTEIMRKYGFNFDPNDERCRPCWCITFKPSTISGGMQEGGVIVDVDAESRAARFFDEAFSTSHKITQ